MRDDGELIAEFRGGPLKLRTYPEGSSYTVVYDPLNDDAQAMALVKKFGIEIHCRTDRNGWYAGIYWENGMVSHSDLNRAICETVAKLQAAKVKP